MVKIIDESDIFGTKLFKFNLNYNLLFKNEKFSELMENEIDMIDGHYQLLLPLKEVILPDNRVAAMKRMQSLSKKFARDR